MTDRLPPWLAAADQAGAGLADGTLVSAATANATGLIEVGEDGSVRWTDEAYRLHGRPRWRRVRSVDDIAHGLSPADAGRLTAAYLTLSTSGDAELLYTVTGETGQPLDVLLRGVRPGFAMVQRAAYQPPAVEPDADEPASAVHALPDDVAAEHVVAFDSPAHVPAPSGAALPDPDTGQAFRALFDASPSGLAELRGDGTFVRVNEAFGRLVGRTWDSLRDTVFEALVHHEDRATVFVSRHRLEGEAELVVPSEYRLLHSDGSVAWVRARTSPIASPEGARLLVSLENVTMSRAREEQLRHDALHDSLTGLPNRRLVLDRLERAVSRARRGGQRLAVFFVDVDDLKHVNDTHPWQHRAGDVLLTSIAGAIRGALRATDTFGRLGGDEFLVICEEVGDDVAVNELSERLLEAARQQVPLGPQTIEPSVSVGLALTGEDDETAEELLARADSAMYVAKSHGGGRVEWAEDLSGATPPDLVGALHRGELRMHYQPVVSLATGAVLGVTAVLRWVHPSLGMLPSHQVRAALDSAAVLPVVDWCIDRAINDVRTVAPGRVDHVSVWLPVPGRAVLATSTRDALRAALLGADASQNPDTAPSLVLEVHETDLGVLARRPSLRRQLTALTETGPVALGVEHLSADVLPVGALQLLGAASASIDPELLLAASENEPSEALVRSLVTAATALGVLTVAAGVSSPELLAEARRLGVHAVCGDLIGPAAPLEIYSDLLHGERITLPDVPEVAVVVPSDDQLYGPGARPVLTQIRGREEDDLTALDALDVLDVLGEADGGEGGATAPAADGVEDLVGDSPGSASSADEAGSEAHAPGSGRLLLGDIVDLAELVARELGVALPPPGDELEAQAEPDAPDVVDDAPLFRRTQQRLPGLADLHAALGSPEVSRVLDDRAGQGHDHGAPPQPSAQAAAPSAPSSSSGITTLPAPPQRPTPPISLATGLSTEPLPYVPTGRTSVAAVAGDPATSISATAEGTDSTEASPAPDVDLRDHRAAEPTILLRLDADDPRATSRWAPTLRLHGRGGSDGGSIL